MERWFWGVLLPLAAVVLAAVLAAAGLSVPASANIVDPGLFLAGIAESCRPEPLEQLRYLLAISVIPACVFFAGLLVRRTGGTVAPPAWVAGLWVGTVQFLFAVFVFAMLGFHWCKDGEHLRHVLPMFGAFAVLGLAWRLCPAEWRRRSLIPVSGRGLPGYFGQWLRWRAPGGIAVVFVTVGLLPSLLHDDAPRVDYYFVHHVSFPINEFAAVLNGRTLRVDFFPQYQSLLAHGLAPLFRFTGLTVTTFTAVMAVLSALGFLLLFRVFCRVTRDPWKALLLFLPFLWVSLVPVREFPEVWHQRVNAFNYYAVGPIRYLGPWVSAALLTGFLRRRSGPRLVALFFAATLAAVNNFDFGVPALGGALVAVLLTEDGWRSWRSTMRLGGGITAGVGLALAASLLLTYGRAGRLPDLSATLYFQQAYARYGYFMLPMPAFGLHWVFYLTFMAAVVRPLLDRSPPPLLRGLSLYSGVFGSGALMYYVGRSHVECLAMVVPAWAFAFLLLVWGKWQGIAAAWGERSRWRVVTPPVLLLAFGYLTCCAAVAKTPNLRGQFHRLRAPALAAWPKLEPFATFVRDHARPGEKVAVICPYGFLIALKAGVDNVFPFGQHESLILRSQLARALEEFEAAKVQRVFGYLGDDLSAELRQRGFRVTAGPEGFALWKRGASTEAEPRISIP